MSIKLKCFSKSMFARKNIKHTGKDGHNKTGGMQKTGQQTNPIDPGFGSDPKCSDPDTEQTQWIPIIHYPDFSLFPYKGWAPTILSCTSCIHFPMHTISHYPNYSTVFRNPTGHPMNDWLFRKQSSNPSVR